MKNICLFILFIIYNVTLFAQNYTGQIFNAETKQPISYASIGIIGKSLGTISDANGVFHINIDKKSNNDTITICLLGYKSTSYKCSDFASKNEGSKKYFLEEVIYNLPEAIIRPKNYISETVGNLGDKNTSISFEITDTLGETGAEVGTYINIKQKLVLIDSIGFGIAENDYDSIIFRINIYKGDNKKASESITKKPIYVTVKKGVNKDFNLDIRRYNISVDGDFIIAAQVVDFPKKEKGKTAKKFSFKGRFLGHGMLLRGNPFSDWEKLPSVSVAFHASVSYEK